MAEPIARRSGDAAHVPTSRGWRIAKRIGLALLLLVVTLILVQVALDPTHKNELGLRGALEIAVDPAIEVYVSDKHVGTGSVEVTWDELLGPEHDHPLAVPINKDSPSPKMDGLGGVTAEALAGDGAEIVWSRKGMTGHAQNLEPISFTWIQVLLRRQDGKLDSISVLDGEFPERLGKWRRFLIPIRLRSGDAEPTVYFSTLPSGGIGSRRAGILPYTRIGSKLRLTLRSAHEEPPDEFADEIVRNGLWKP